MKKGLSDAVFIPTWNTDAFLKASAQAEFDGVELNVREKGGDLTLDTTLREAKSLGQNVRDHGLEIASLSTGLHNYYALSSNDETLRQRGKEIGLKMIEYAVEMEVPLIQIVPGVIHPSEPYDAAYNLAMESLAILGNEASKAGVMIGVENVCNNFLPSPLEFVRFLDEIGSSAVQAYFDNGNAMVTGHPEHFIHLLGSRIVGMHVKDYRRSSDFVSILEGDMNWPVVMKALEDIPYTEYMIVTPPYLSAYHPEWLVDKANSELEQIFKLLNPDHVHWDF